jgi:hypothetical protein
MSGSSDFNGLSKIYEESGKVRISLEGKKFNKIDILLMIITTI